MTTTKPTKRLTLTAAERRVLLEEYDSFPPGDARRGALLRRHGLYTSQMAKWRARLQRGDSALDVQVPGPKPPLRHPLAADHEDAALAEQLIADACTRKGIATHQLTVSSTSRGRGHKGTVA